MSRPEFIHLDEEPARWVDVPMTGANKGVTVVGLASIPGTLTVLCRFPAGFIRHEPGGYLAAEEFLVLDGSITFEGVRYTRGDLTYIPGSFRRTDMHSEDGCTVVAWFGGTADYLSLNDLAASVTEPLQSVSLGRVREGQIMATSEATWFFESSSELSQHSEAIDAQLTRWGYGEEGGSIVSSDAPWLHRRPTNAA